MSGPDLVGPHLQRFFTDHLVAQRRLSLQTIASYRDTFRLLLQFVHRETRVEPASLSIPELNANRILDFLNSLEKERKNTIASRKLAAHSDTLVLPYGCPPRPGECRSRNERTRDSAQTSRHQSALVSNARRNGRDPCSVGPKQWCGDETMPCFSPCTTQALVSQKYPFFTKIKCASERRAMFSYMARGERSA